MAAVGALLNIVGGEEPDARAQLRELLCDGLVIGAVKSAIFDF